MRKLTVILSVLLFSASVALADTYVRGYYRSNGTYVRPHYRSDPDGIKWNNYGSSESDDELLNPKKRDGDDDGIPNYLDHDDDNDGIFDDNE